MMKRNRPRPGVEARGVSQDYPPDSAQDTAVATRCLRYKGPTAPAGLRSQGPWSLVVVAIVSSMADAVSIV